MKEIKGKGCINEKYHVAGNGMVVVACDQGDPGLRGLELVSLHLRLVPGQVELRSSLLYILIPITP